MANFRSRLKNVAMIVACFTAFLFSGCDDNDPKQFTVTFNSNGGSEVLPLIVEGGKKVTKPVDPTRTGQIFDAWYKEAALTNEWMFDIDVVTADITLHAKWSEESGDLSVIRFQAKSYTGSEKIKYSYSYEGYDFYYIYLGELANIPIFSFSAQQYNGLGATSHTISIANETRTSVEQTVSNSSETVLTTVDEHTVSRTTGGRVSAVLTTGIPILGSLKTSAESHWEDFTSNTSSTTFQQTTSLTHTVTHATSHALTTMEASTIQFLKVGFYRYTMFAVSDVYLWVVKNPEGEIYYEFREHVKPNTPTTDNYYWTWDFSETTTFGKNDASSFEVDLSILENLPEPLVMLKAKPETVNLATVTQSGTQFTWDDPVLTVNSGENLIITTDGANTTRQIVVNGTSNITLIDVSITGLDPDQSAMLLNSNANVTLTLLGENTLTSGTNSAGIQTTGATLTISGNGSLTVTGGSGGAGIGGSMGEDGESTTEPTGATDGYSGSDGGTITIISGTITATGGDGAAGIGGGRGGRGGDASVGNTTSNGNVRGGSGGNGAQGGNGGTITINGGTITATGGSDAGGSDAAGIGGGCGGRGGYGGRQGGHSGDGGAGGSGGTIIINGGTITAIDGGDAAGIGGGRGGYAIRGRSWVGIPPNTHGNGGRSGDGGSGGIITINNGTIRVTRGEAGIGGGNAGTTQTYGLNGYNATLGDNGARGTVNINGGSVTAL